MSLRRLLRRTAEVFKEGGIKALFLKIRFYMRDTAFRGRRKITEKGKKFADVLFINGCYLPHPSRYRVAHQMEQLRAVGMDSQEVFYTDLTLDYVKRYRVFIFYRCPYTDEIGEFINKAKSSNKTVFFDVDDLVIDKKYTDRIPYISNMKKEEKDNYDEGVDRMRKTLQLCDAAITTTEALANELRNYTSEVFINRNVASDEMCRYSEEAIYLRDVLPTVSNEALTFKMRRKKRKILKNKAKSDATVKIGYFSGSITHNDDIELVLPVLCRIMNEFPQVHLYFVGKLNIPRGLEPFRNRIHIRPFVDWKSLPSLIAGVDINIAPLADSIFNAAKSENKWIEAALVKVPTIASRVGAMERMIIDGENGVLCSTAEEWMVALSKLITDGAYRHLLASNAYEFAKQNCTTINTGLRLRNFLKGKMVANVAFVLPSLQISGGVLVVLKHGLSMKKAGYDVLIINDNVGDQNVFIDGEELNVLSTRDTCFVGWFDVAVGTLWSTMNWVCSYRNIMKRAYLVQGFETNFYEPGCSFRFDANRTYLLENVSYVTVSKWCERWLRDQFGQTASFIPNGLDLAKFQPIKRSFGEGKIRILVEGNCDDYYKNVDESFRIVQLLDDEKFEIWFLSYQGVAKKWYRVDKFFHRVPYEKVSEIYRSCHILLKSSILESFSYPPLEMMATGGFVVVRLNEGNSEYLKNDENCLIYDPDHLQTAVDAIKKIVSDEKLRERLWEGGQETADSRSWSNFEKQIAQTYVG